MILMVPKHGGDEEPFLERCCPLAHSPARSGHGPSVPLAGRK